MADAVRASEQRWSAETEQGVVVAVYRAADTDGYGAMPRPDGVFDPALRDARAALAYLADSGRLLPDGGETREERRIRFVDPDGQEHTRALDGERMADVHVGELATKGITAQKERRAVIVSPGPWEPVS